MATPIKEKGGFKLYHLCYGNHTILQIKRGRKAFAVLHSRETAC